MNLELSDVAIHVGSPYIIEGEVERQFYPERWKRKVQAKDLRNVKAFLHKGLLSTAHFDTWKEDIVRATEAVLLIGRKHWATVNRLIATRLNEDMYQTVTSFFPNDEARFEALDPKELLKRIEERLVTTDQIEHKRL